MKYSLSFLILFSALFFGVFSNTVEAKVSDQEIAAVVRVSIINLVTGEEEVSGSGVRINPDGDILTNHHVIELALHNSDYQIVLCFNQGASSVPKCDFAGEVGSSRKVKTLIGGVEVVPHYDALLDLALITPVSHLGKSAPRPGKKGARLETPIREYFETEQITPLPYVSFNRNREQTTDPALGDEVQVLGYPGESGDQITFTQGIVNGFETYEPKNGDPLTFYLRTDAKVQPGNSGGGAFDAESKFIGVPTALSLEDEEVGYVTALQVILYFLDSIQESEKKFCTASGGCSCNEGYTLGNDPLRYNTEKICKTTISLQCGINSSNIVGTNYCKCRDGYEWVTNTEESFMCAANLTDKKFDVPKTYEGFGIQQKENIASSFEISSALYEVQGEVYAGLTWELPYDPATKRIVRSKATVWKGDDSFDIASKNVVARQSASIEENEIYFPYLPTEEYFVELLAHNAEGDIMEALHFKTTIQDRQLSPAICKVGWKWTSEKTLQCGDQPVNSEDPTSFRDVPKNHKNQIAIQYLQEHHILNGYQDGTFRPDATVNRAELIKVLVEANVQDFLASSFENDCFVDVPKGEWFTSYICYAKEKGWVSGYKDGTFKPAQTVSKVEAVKIILTAYKFSLFLSTQDLPFPDVPKSEWFVPYLVTALEKGILEETAGEYNPHQGMSRASTSESIYRVLLQKEADTSIDN